MQHIASIMTLRVPWPRSPPNKKDNTLTLLADYKDQLEAVIQVLKEKMARRHVLALTSPAEVLALHVGIDPDSARSR